MIASFYDMEYITLFDMPKAYKEYTSSDASLFVCVVHQRYYLDTENNILLTAENLQRSAYPKILFFVLPSECILICTFQDTFLSIFYPLPFVSLDLVFSISFDILVSFFLFALDSYNTMFYTPMNQTDSRIGEESNSSFAYPVTAGGMF